MINNAIMITFSKMEWKSTMLDNYDDIIHLTRPQYDDLHPMSMSDWAAQFSPLAALVG